MSHTPWLDPKGIRFAVLLAVAAALANSVWLWLDNSVPSWDQAHYLDVAWQYRQVLGNEGVVSLLRAIRDLDPTRGPLFPLLLLPLSYVFGSAARTGLLLNFLLSPVLYLAAGEIAAMVFRNWRARLIAILLVATMPLMVGLYHNVLQDFLLTTLATVSILLLLKSDLFRRRGMVVALGVAMGLGTLTKVTFPAFVIGPLLIVGAHAAITLRRKRQEGEGAVLREVGINVAMLVGVYLVLIAPWYVTNFDATKEYIEWTTESGLGVGPENPLTATAIISFTEGVMNSNVSWIIGIAGLISGLLCVPNIRDFFGRRPIESQRLIDLGCVLTWALIPYISVATAHNQDVRLMAPATVGLAVLVAGAMAAIRWPGVRTALVSIVALALVYQTANRVTDLHPDFLPETLSLKIGSREAVIPLKSQPIGYEQLPRPDYGDPFVEYMESTAGRLVASRTVPPATVCLLESEPVVNTNTVKFLSDIRGDPFSYVDVFIGPGGEAELNENLAGCGFALYVKQAPLDVLKQIDPRLAVVNAKVAARFMTPRTFGIFKGPSKTFYVGQSSPNDGSARSQSSGNYGEYVTVLTRDRIPQ